MYDLTKEMVAKEHRKDLIREAEEYYILYRNPSRKVKSRGFYAKSLTYLGLVLSHLGRRLQARYGACVRSRDAPRFMRTKWCQYLDFALVPGLHVTVIKGANSGYALRGLRRLVRGRRLPL